MKKVFTILVVGLAAAVVAVVGIVVLAVNSDNMSEEYFNRT